MLHILYKNQKQRTSFSFYSTARTTVELLRHEKPDLSVNG